MCIEILTFEGCPNSAIARERVRDAIEAEGVLAIVRQVEVETPEEAQRLRFLGSPTIRVDGDDVEPGADERIAYGFMCRTYSIGESTSGAPTVEMIRAAIRAHGVSASVD